MRSWEKIEDSHIHTSTLISNTQTHTPVTPLIYPFPHSLTHTHTSWAVGVVLFEPSIWDTCHHQIFILWFCLIKYSTTRTHLNVQLGIKPPVPPPGVRVVRLVLYWKWKWCARIIHTNLSEEPQQHRVKRSRLISTLLSLSHTHDWVLQHKWRQTSTHTVYPIQSCFRSLFRHTSIGSPIHFHITA